MNCLLLLDTHANVRSMWYVVQRTGSPLLSKPITAELGNITPFIIVPGEWSEEDIRYQAENVASGLMQNSGHNCIAAEVRGRRTRRGGGEQRRREAREGGDAQEKRQQGLQHLTGILH